MLFYREYRLDETRDWVVFVHGAGGSSSIWYKQIKAFKKHFNVLLVDLRGHGRSKDLLKEYVENNYSFRDISRDILEVVEHLKIPQAHFVGVSLGSIIIRTIGELAPERLRSLVLCGAITRLNIRSRFLVGLGHTFKRFVPYMWLYKLFAWIIMPHKRDKVSRNLFIREAKRLYKKEFLRWYTLTNEVNPLLKYFKEKDINVPTLYVMGEHDYMFLPPVKHIVTLHQQAVLRVIENCGHVVNVEKPEVFNREALQFINQHALVPGIRY
ncbi:MAG: alpha/beta hydrolase [Cyclobacteriaceae bacterium]